MRGRVKMQAIPLGWNYFAFFNRKYTGRLPGPFLLDSPLSPGLCAWRTGSRLCVEKSQFLLKMVVTNPTSLPPYQNTLK